MKAAVDISKVITDEYEKKWVALSPDRKKVISFNESLVDLRKEIGAKNVVYMKVPPTGAYLSF